MKWEKKAPPSRPEGRPSKGLYLVLGGLVLGGIVTWWRWLRSVRKY